MGVHCKIGFLRGKLPKKGAWTICRFKGAEGGGGGLPKKRGWG